MQANNSDVTRLLAAGTRSAAPLLDKVAAGDVNAACAAQMLCTNAYEPWLQQTGIGKCVTAFAHAIEWHACDKDLDAEKRRSLFCFCLPGMSNALFHCSEAQSESQAHRRLHKENVLPTISRALDHWYILSSQEGGTFDARIHFFMLVSNVVKPHNLSDFGAAPFLQIATHAVEFLAKGDALLQSLCPNQPVGKTKLLVVNLLHRLVDLDAVQSALWSKCKPEMARLVEMIEPAQNDIAMDLLDIFNELGKADHGQGIAELWQLPGYAGKLTALARRSAFKRSEGYGSSDCTQVTSRWLAFGCLTNMCAASDACRKMGWKAGVFDCALVGLRAGDDELRTRSCELIDVLSSDLDGVRKHASSATTRALLEHAIGLSAVLPEATSTALIRTRQKLDSFERRTSTHTELYRHACRACSKSETDEVRFSACARCNRAFYCSRECQLKDWPSHKAECKKLAKRVKENGKSSSAKSYEMLSATFLQDNFMWLAATAEMKKIPLGNVVLYLDFCHEPSPRGTFPSCQLFAEKEALQTFRRHSWWTEELAPTLEGFLRKRAECKAAGDTRMQFVHLCTFEGDQFYGGRWMIDEENTAKLGQWLRSKDGREMKDKMAFDDARRAISMLVTQFEGADKDAPLLGEKVIIKGLLRQTELNGKTGDAEAFDAASGRYRVRLSSGSVVMVPPGKLEPTRYDGCPKHPADFLDDGDGWGNAGADDDNESESVSESAGNPGSIGFAEGAFEAEAYAAATCAPPPEECEQAVRPPASEAPSAIYDLD